MWIESFATKLLVCRADQDSWQAGECLGTQDLSSFLRKGKSIFADFPPATAWQTDSALLASSRPIPKQIMAIFIVVVYIKFAHALSKLRKQLITVSNNCFSEWSDHCCIQIWVIDARPRTGSKRNASFWKPRLLGSGCRTLRPFRRVEIGRAITQLRFDIASPPGKSLR